MKNFTRISGLALAAQLAFLPSASGQWGDSQEFGINSNGGLLNSKVFAPNIPQANLDSLENQNKAQTGQSSSQQNFSDLKGKSSKNSWYKNALNWFISLFY
jgi:hypothetical protein